MTRVLWCTHSLLKPNTRIPHLFKVTKLAKTLSPGKKFFVKIFGVLSFGRSKQRYSWAILEHSAHHKDILRCGWDVDKKLQANQIYFPISLWNLICVIGSPRLGGELLTPHMGILVPFQNKLRSHI